MGGNDLLAQVMASGQLVVGTDPKYPPQSLLVNGQWEGFDIDVANEIATRMGLTTKFTTPSWNQVVSGNWQGRMDVSVGSVTITADRAKVLTFTSPYYYTPAGVAVYDTNTSIKSPADLAGKVVGVCGGCSYEEYLKGTLNIPDYPVDFQITGAQIKTYGTDSVAIQDLAKGDCLVLCAVFSAVPTLQNAADKGQPIKLLGDPLYFEPLAVAVDKESQVDSTSLGAKITEIVDAMHADGTLSQLSCKWYKTDLTVPDPASAMDCSTISPAA
jgi:polar amino acid transport system substrate-binding protein